MVGDAPEQSSTGCGGDAPPDAGVGNSTRDDGIPAPLSSPLHPAGSAPPDVASAAAVRCVDTSGDGSSLKGADTPRIVLSPKEQVGVTAGRAPAAPGAGDEVRALRLLVAELESANMLMSTQMSALQEELDRLKKERTPKVLSPAKRDMASGSESAARKYAHRQHALHDAARDGDVGAIQYIAQHLDEFDYKSLDDVNEDGNSALHRAVACRQAGVVDALLLAGADASKPGHLAWAPLHVAVAHGSDEAMLQALCSAV